MYDKTARFADTSQSRDGEYREGMGWNGEAGPQHAWNEIL